MPKRGDDLLVADICESCERILKYTTGMDYETFLADQRTIDATIRNFEIIGEASRRVSEDLREAYPLIEWRLMADFRNRLIHEYFGTDHQLLYNLIGNELLYNYEMLKQIRL